MKLCCGLAQYSGTKLAESCLVSSCIVVWGRGCLSPNAQAFHDKTRGEGCHRPPRPAPGHLVGRRTVRSPSGEVVRVLPCCCYSTSRGSTGENLASSWCLTIDQVKMKMPMNKRGRSSSTLRVFFSRHSGKRIMGDSVKRCNGQLTTHLKKLHSTCITPERLTSAINANRLQALFIRRLSLDLPPSHSPGWQLARTAHSVPVPCCGNRCLWAFWELLVTAERQNSRVQTGQVKQARASIRIPSDAPKVIGGWTITGVAMEVLSVNFACS